MAFGGYFKFPKFEDHSVDGKMTYQDYVKAMTQYKLFPGTVKETFYGTSFRIADLESDGVITQKEFNKIMKAYGRVNIAGDEIDKMVYFIFCLLDDDASGLISVDEMTRLMRLWGLKEDRETILSYMNIYDTNHSGKISYEEFYYFKPYLY